MAPKHRLQVGVGDLLVGLAVHVECDAQLFSEVRDHPLDVLVHREPLTIEGQTL